MAEDDAGLRGDGDDPRSRDEPELVAAEDEAREGRENWEDREGREGRPTEVDREGREGRPTEVAVVEVGRMPAVQWRRRALAVRAAVPQLARNPVVVGASAAVATVALRVAVDVAQRALGGSGSSRPRALAVTGTILHEVHVHRHVNVVHHVVHHYPYGPLPPWSRWPPP